MAFGRGDGGWVVAAAIGLCMSMPVLAQGQKTLRVLVGFPAGQTTDLVARLIAERMATALGYPVIVENRPRQGGSLALGLLAKSPPEASVMTISALGMVTRPAGSAEFGTYLKSEHERWGRIVRDSDARVE